ncbi:hypothetical protein BJV77DRAFT_42670 [Russula vinacea]|nr:hypothetical protein BJV77DRAFT_42670 [Russula vinacea]
MFSECFGVLLVLFSSFVVYRVIPLLLSHSEIFFLSAQEQCCDSKNVAQKRSHCALPSLSLFGKADLVLIGSEIHRQPFASPISSSTWLSWVARALLVCGQPILVRLVPSP